MLRRLITGALLGALLSAPALAQSIQVPAGGVLGNSTAAQRPANATTVTALLDRALGSTRGAIIERGASGWAILAPGAAGLAFVSAGAGADPSYGIVGLNGGGCNAALTASNGGILYSTATACAILAGTATAGQIIRSGSSAAPSWSTATFPATAAAGTILSALTANAVTATPNPVLGIAGSVVGDIGFQNATSGTVILRPVTGALGSGVVLIPAASGTIAVSATSPITLSAAGAIGITGAALTKTDDTNVTATLGGSPTTALVNAASITLGWTGQLSVARGGTGLSSGTSGGVLYYSAAGTIASSGALGANQIVLGGGAGVAPSTMACATTTTLLHGGTPPTCGQLVYADIASAALATAANYYTGAASVLVTASVIYPPEVTVPYGTTTTFDFDTFINAVVTLTGNITTQTLSNAKTGKAGLITFIQDGTGSRTSVWNSVFKFAGGTTPTLSTTASAIDVLSYSCRTTTFCVASLMKDVR